MKTNHQETRKSDELLLDRLVDGELSETERRELLSHLDDEPNGWRRCALAFLEAQCWRQALASPLTAEGTRRGPDTEKSDARPMSAPGKKSSWPGWTNAALAMAASFLVAMWIGAVAQRWQPGETVSLTGNQIAATDAPASSTATDSLDGPWKLVTVSNAAQPGASMQLPAVERDKIDEQWLRSVPPAIPEDIRAALSRTGHQIQERRALMPVQLQDGRRLLVPVDQVEVQYVGNRTY